MSSVDFRAKRTDKNKATKLIKEIVASRPGNIMWTQHAEERLVSRNLTTLDVMNVLASPASRVNREGEPHQATGFFVYTCETTNIAVVLQFWPNGMGLTILTAMRKKDVLHKLRKR